MIKQEELVNTMIENLESLNTQNLLAIKQLEDIRDRLVFSRLNPEE